MNTKIKSQRRKLTREKNILPLLLLGLESVTFQSGVQHSNHEAIPAPQMYTAKHCKTINFILHNATNVQSLNQRERKCTHTLSEGVSICPQMHIRIDTWIKRKREKMKVVA